MSGEALGVENDDTLDAADCDAETIVFGQPLAPREAAEAGVPPLDAIVLAEALQGILTWLEQIDERLRQAEAKLVLVPAL